MKTRNRKSDRPDESRRHLLKLLAAGSGLLVFPLGSLPTRASAADGTGERPPYWAYAVDTTRCMGCCACMRACRDENGVPKGVFRTWVERYRIDLDDEVHVDVAMHDDFVFAPAPGDVARAFFVPKLCNHCEKSVCNQVCPVGAAYRTADGVVLVDAEHCIGCGYCVQACPYGSRFINPESHVADKCTFCYHRLARGLAPACVLTCPREARLFGDLNDPQSKLSVLLRQRPYRLLKPELGTHPKCYYLGLDREVV
ncbi:MAG TPA: 4Fe-4S dicluster domain-containing protein [Candidatus Krumholzibacteria bacterium]|nr:4Fe-4S dicluster domain-containing protein [Candidatus Krumholzibacteria bacterium]HPD70542.1 4Fe-4S dicluster domain-containing protein [Candidatus Krumholzibacteria bacterium]HRY39758.1 4Fe-4S dicluster domain-containing protein [Candidatus Krumholzibacteria bacterium]